MKATFVFICVLCPILFTPLVDMAASMTLMKETGQVGAEVTIEKVLSGRVPGGTTVTITGRFRGWRGCVDSTFMLTRSDWALEDGSGCIMVSGPLPRGLNPHSSVQPRITVEGVVTVIPGKGVVLKAVAVHLVDRLEH